MIRLFCSDFDGTLGRSGRISADNCAAVRALQNAGVDFALVTGRPYANAVRILRRHHLNAHVVACNGALSATADGRICAEKPLPSEIAMKIFQGATHRGWLFAAYDQSRCLIPRWAPLVHGGWIESKVHRSTGILPVRWRGEALDQWKITKINLYALHGAKAGSFRALYQDPALYVTTSSPRKIEIQAAGVSKWEGIRVLAQTLGYQDSEIATIGDYDNDVPMLKQAALSFAMGNGSVAARMAADFVVAPVDQNGFADAAWKIIGDIQQHEKTEKGRGK